MKRFVGILLIIYLCVLLLSCDILKTKKAEIVLDGNLQRTYTDYGTPRFEGHVKNIGNKTAYNCMVTIICYSDANKTNIIDTAKGFPADLGDFNCNSHDDIKSYDVEITWLEKD